MPNVRKSAGPASRLVMAGGICRRPGGIAFGARSDFDGVLGPTPATEAEHTALGPFELLLVFGSERGRVRHAELAVSLAGAVATFVIATWEAKRFTA